MTKSGITSKRPTHRVYVVTKADGAKPTELVGSIVTEGESILLEGLNPWEYKWNSVKAPSIIVPDLHYPAQEHAMDIYEISDGKKTVRFAAGEFSNGVWGFYLEIAKT